MSFLDKIEEMDLVLNKYLIGAYSSESQKVRVMTEKWVDNSIFCPNCGHPEINNYPNNKPVGDFYCVNCKEDYELKSKKNSIGSKIVDGAYKTMIGRLRSDNNPNFFFLNYDLPNYTIKNFIVIPRHFFVPEIIEKRKPLALTARRAGWIGCNILLHHIPESGKIYYVRDGQIRTKDSVRKEWQKTLFLRDGQYISGRGWILDIMRCIESLKLNEFTLDEVYRFEEELHKLHPENKHVKDKIRQQLQILRDRGYLEFTSRGKYRLT